MIRQEPPSDWVAYVVVLLVTLGTLLGKYLIAKGDKPIDEVIEEEIDHLNHPKDTNK